MPFDISKLTRAAAAYTTLDNVRDLLARTGLDEAEHIRELMRPSVTAQSLIASMAEEEARQHQSMVDALNVQPTIDRLMDEYRRQQEAAAGFTSQYVAGLLEDERTIREHYRQMLSSPAESAMKTLFQHARDIENLVDLKGPAWPAFEAAASADRLMKDALKIADPFRAILDQVRTDQLTAASWLHQLQSAAETAKGIGLAWPVGDEVENGTVWAAIEQSLASVHAAIHQLPPQQATRQQLRATGLSRFEWLMLVTSLFGLLLQLLSYVETLEQGQFAREQAAHRATDDKALVEQRAFRQQLLSAIETLAEHAPPAQNAVFVVGSRPATIRTAPKVGHPVGTAYPNQLVTVVDHRGRWVKIQFRDNLAERDIEGWVLKHYLIRQIEVPAEEGGEGES